MQLALLLGQLQNKLKITALLSLTPIGHSPRRMVLCRLLSLSAVISKLCNFEKIRPIVLKIVSEPSKVKLEVFMYSLGVSVLSQEGTL